jgi:hypothetical protein
MVGFSHEVMDMHILDKSSKNPTLGDFFLTPAVQHSMEMLDWGQVSISWGRTAEKKGQASCTAAEWLLPLYPLLFSNSALSLLETM